MKTVSSAHFGWSRLKVKATSSASSPEAVVFAAKIHGIQRGATIGFDDPAHGLAAHDEAVVPIPADVSGTLRRASACEFIHARIDCRLIGTVAAAHCMNQP